MQQLNTNNSSEISLRQLIEMLLKGKKIIIVITVISLIISGVMNFVYTEPVYEATTILMAPSATEKLTNQQKNSEEMGGMLDLLNAYPTMTLQTYKEQITSPKILQATIAELKLNQYNLNIIDLADMIELSIIPNTNLITIKVTHKDAVLATNIANTLAKQFTVFISDLSKQQASKSSQFLAAQLETENKKLDASMLELKEFLSGSKGVKELNEEFNSKIMVLTDYQKQLIDKEIEFNKTKAALAASELELKHMPKVYVTKKSIGENPLLNQVYAEKNHTSVKDAAEITMVSEEINDSYTNLQGKVSEYKIAVSMLGREVEEINTKIDSTQKELDSIRLELADKSYRQRQIERKVDISEETYGSFLKKYEEARIAESSEVGDSTIQIVSQAVVPEFPKGSGKMFKLAIGGVLGLMLGMGIVLFREYWIASGTQSHKNNSIAS